MDVNNDDRKVYFIKITSEFIDIPHKESTVKNILNDDCLNRFLNDVSCLFFWIVSSNGTYKCSNEIPKSDNQKHQQLVFMKLKPDVITTENMKTGVLVLTLVGSPISTFYYAFKQLFVPVVLQNKIGKEPQLQSTMKNLESRLQYALYQASNSEDFVVTTVGDEIRYWRSVEESSSDLKDIGKAKAFLEILGTLENDFSSLDGVSSVDLDDLIESTSSVLDELWRLDSYSYPQARMERLMDAIGNSIALHLQKTLDKLDVWNGDFNTVRDVLNAGISACEKWIKSVQNLCTVYWSNSSERPWDKEIPKHQLCSDLALRLNEIKDIRSVFRQLTRLLSVSEQKELGTASSFSYFKDVDAKICSPYTEPMWKAAVKQFEKSLSAMEQRVAVKLKTQLRHLNANTLQLLQELKRYQELIKRPNIAQHLVAERENLLGLLKEYIDSVNVNDEIKGSLVDMPPVVAKIYWAKQLKSKIQDVKEANAELLHDLKGSGALKENCDSLLKQLTVFENEQFDEWVREVNSGIKNTNLTLSEDSKVLQLKEGRMVKVNYNPKLGQLIREVQQLSVLGMKIPIKIKEVSDRALKFTSQAKALEQIANFHNTIGDRIIPSQLPMLLPAAQELDNLVTSQQGVTWSDTVAVERYIGKLQDAVERLSKENNKLAFYHTQIRDKVLTLMDVDIIRQQNSWKQGLRDIRDIISQVEALKFPNMKSWKLHWDYQLYKALERQYQLSLCNLHSHFPEINVELIYRQQKLQFQPPIEEIRMKYYGQVKRFLSIPNTFRGVSDNTGPLFAKIIPRNAFRFSEVFSEAEELFERLEKVKEKWYKWVSLGGVNLEKMADENLEDAEDWDFNFRASKNLGQEIGKLEYHDEKIGCITVSVLPIRAEIELHNRRYWDALVFSLQSSIIREINNLEKYINDSTQVLNTQPRTMSEVGEAHSKHAQILAQSNDMYKLLESVVKKNKTLASWTKEKLEQVNKMVVTWDNFQSNLQNYESIIGRQVEAMKASLHGETENLLAEVEKFGLRWEQQRPRDTDIQDASLEMLKKSLVLIKEKHEEWDQLKATKERLLNEYDQFVMEKPDFTLFEKTEEDLKNCEAIWSFYDEFHSDLNNLTNEEWILFRGKTYRLSEFLTDWEKKIEEREATPMTVRMLQEISTYKAVVPLLKYVRGEMFSEKHWLEMFSLLGMTNKPPEALILGDFLAVKDQIVVSDQRLQELNARAASEISIRQTLGELDAWEVQARFTLTPHNDSKSHTLMLIKDFSDVLNKIGDNQCLLQSITNATNSKSFADRTAIWENKLTNLDEAVRNLNIVQRKWVYLEPIFGNGTFAMEQGRFDRVDQDFRYIMSEVAKDNHVVALNRIINLRQTLNMLMDQLARCQNSLNQYLQEKRSSFPRFYFLGDDDLLELLGQATKEKVIQTHLKKLFAGINTVVLEDGFVKSVKSLHGEVLTLSSPVKITTNIEEWLSNLNVEVKKTLKSQLIKCIEESESPEGTDPLKYPSQILCLGESVWFTSKCEEHISKGKLQNFHKALKAKLDVYTGTVMDWSDEDDVLELKLKALLLDAIHHIDIVESLIENNVSSVNDWHWQKQLRFYLESDRTAVARMVDAELQYTYEYQGNAPKLVRTPLTEKCFLTLTQAIRMGLGGNPYGPAGTGKTESVKALGGLLGRQVLVFNCDEGIDVKSMARIFVGLVKCGAWGCFDEFNRLEETTLSAVSMLIQPIQASLRGAKKTVKIFDEEVPIDLNCGLFVTLNPAGKEYGGRQKLPDNLKQLFRPVVMSVPDNELIAQVSLFSNGFKDAKTIGRKLVQIFDLSRDLLSKQQHYDWGLRALKTVLGSCGSLLKEKRKEKENQEFSEMEIAVEALRFNTLSKLTFGDCALFDNLVRDVFVGVSFVSSEFQKLTDALRSSCEELGLQISEHQIKKCIELYEQMQQRMGVALVGPSGAGKSTILKLLKHGLSKVGRNVKQHIMNPKSMPRTQLLGQIDLDTRQWSEGVLTNSALKLHSESSDTNSWLICDGDIDPEWVEALNSVLDDNRLLTLPSGWRIQFGPNVNFLFETCDLTHASPATVSRMGIIFLSDEAVDITLVVKSWLLNQPEDNRRFLESYISDYFYKCVDWIRKKGNTVIPYSLVGLINSGLSHLQDVTNKPNLVIALIYGLGANLSLESREAYAKHVFETVGEYIPDPSRVLDCYYNPQRERIDLLQADVSDYDISNQKFNLVLTATAKTSVHVLNPWLNSYQPVLIAGPEGCGKNLLLKYCLKKLPATEVAIIHCSALISPNHVIQKLKQVCMVTSSPNGRVFRPKNSQKLVLYLKNLELAKPDVWGTNMLIAWLQQLLSYNGFYDTDLEWTSLERIQIIGSLNDGGHTPTPRLTSLTRVYYVSPPDNNDLKIIYLFYINSIMEQNFAKHKAWSVQSRMTTLVGTLLTVYQQVRTAFTQMMQKHYMFSTRDLTRWCNGIRRYTIESADPIRSLLEVVVYEAMRIFQDRLVNDEDRKKLKAILQSIIENEWNQTDLVQSMDQIYFVTDGNRKTLTKLQAKDWTQSVEKGILMSVGNESEILVIDELLGLSSSIDRCLSASKGSLLLAGRPGVGRKTALKIVSALQSTRLITLNMGYDYNVKNFRIDLKNALQVAGIEGESVYLIVEGHQIIDDTYMDMINSLLCSGEVPGLYNPDELDSTISCLKDLASQEGFSGSTPSFFARRVLNNLHVILILDYEDPNFMLLCENNPGIYTKCDFVWLSGWSSATMRIIPRLLFSKLEESDLENEKENFEKLAAILSEIHSSVSDKSATPRRYLAFVNTCIRLYSAKRLANIERAKGLQAGVGKLTEARAVVSKLKSEATKQEEKLAEKKSKASAALDLIGETMKNANIHKGKMEKLKEQTESESKVLMERKKAIDKELAEVEPLIAEARQAVGNIKNESLSEIRSLRAPPDVIRDILEGVLRLMGIQDTSWNSMKTFLAKRGVKEEIRTFDAHRISEDSREAVDLLMQERKDSFDPRVAKRASVAAAPLAAWVIANIKYAKVLEKIRPLEREQQNLQQNLQTTEDQVGKLSTGLGEVDKKVAELKEQLNTYTREAAILEIHLAEAQERMSSAQDLVSKLEDEYNRWRSQLTELSEDLKQLPKNALLAAAFISYLAPSTEDSRQKILNEWEKKFSAGNFSLIDSLCTEHDKLKWLSEGLSSDQLSIENGVIILESWLRPYLVDPNGIAATWLKNHFNDKNVEIVSQHNPRFQTNLELSVRFGKTLIVEDVDDVHPVLIPILRMDVINQGPRQVIYVGDKAVDYHKDFKLFLITRSTNSNIPPDATGVSFTTTKQGLSRQLLASAIQQERPDLESRRSEVLKQQEEMKSKLFDLQEILLQKLASAQGDILQNKDLLNSLNQTKASSEEISKALIESKNLEALLDKECESYNPVAEFGSHLYFTITALSEICRMYQYSVQAFKKLFQRSLKIVTIETENNFENQKKNLIKVVYQYISRSLFKSERLGFALYLAKHAYPEKIKNEEWRVLIGEAISDLKMDQRNESLPRWAEEHAFDINVLRSSLPNFFQTLEIHENQEWLQFIKSGHCEKEIPKNIIQKITPFQTLLLIQAFRPDRLHSVMSQFAVKTLSVESLSPASSRLSQVVEESINVEPILLIVSPGADPSEELRTLSKTSLGVNLHEIALGQGQTTVAMDLLKTCARDGDWLCLKNLHLTTSWLGDLEKEFRSLKPHVNFRLWMTTEPHDHFNLVLANSCLKITYEAPPGIKKNLQRTYGSWTSDMFRRKGVLYGRTMFAAAWFHAVVQERRTYIPQGWSKFYEITDSDLFASTDLIGRIFSADAASVNWNFIHGLLQNAIYGGRIDNDFDIRVLKAYLHEFFNDSVLNKGRDFGPGITLPSSESYSEYLELIHKLLDFDKPSYFGLPDNIERSWQKITSSQVVDQLKILGQSSRSKNFDVKSWQQNLSSVLNLWKKLNQNAGLIETKFPNSSTNPTDDPVLDFLHKDFRCGIKLIQNIHKNLASTSKVIRGIILPNSETIRVAENLLSHQTPSEWQTIWKGPENPLKYLRTVVGKAMNLQKMTQKTSSDFLMQEELDLSDFFQMKTFLKAVKQLTARKTKVPLDELEVSCDWKGGLKSARISFRAKNLQLEGASFDGLSFVHTTAESPSVTTAPPITIAFIKKESLDLDKNEKGVVFPVYRTSERDELIMTLKVPCGGTPDEWFKSGAAFFFKD